MSFRALMVIIMVGFLLVPGIAGAVSDEDFEINATENLLNLCTASPGDPLYYQAVNFCHGFLVGAYHYHVAESNGSRRGEAGLPARPAALPQ